MTPTYDRAQARAEQRMRRTRGGYVTQYQVALRIRQRIASGLTKAGCFITVEGVRKQSMQNAADMHYVIAANGSIPHTIVKLIDTHMSDLKVVSLTATALVVKAPDSWALEEGEAMTDNPELIPTPVIKIGVRYHWDDPSADVIRIVTAKMIVRGRVKIAWAAGEQYRDAWVLPDELTPMGANHTEEVLSSEQGQRSSELKDEDRDPAVLTQHSALSTQNLEQDPHGWRTEIEEAVDRDSFIAHARAVDAQTPPPNPLPVHGEGEDEEPEPPADPETDAQIKAAVQEAVPSQGQTVTLQEKIAISGQAISLIETIMANAEKAPEEKTPLPDPLPVHGEGKGKETVLSSEERQRSSELKDQDRGAAVVTQHSLKADEPMTVEWAWRTWLALTPLMRVYLDCLRIGEQPHRKSAPTRDGLERGHGGLIKVIDRQGWVFELTGRGRDLLRIIDSSTLGTQQPALASDEYKQAEAQMKKLAADLFDEHARAEALRIELAELNQRPFVTENLRMRNDLANAQERIKALERAEQAPKPLNEADFIRRQNAELKAENERLQQQVAAKQETPVAAYRTQFRMDTSPAFIDGLLTKRCPILAIVGGVAPGLDRHDYRDTINVVYLEPVKPKETVLSFESKEVLSEEQKMEQGGSDSALSSQHPVLDLNDPARLHDLYEHRKETMGAKKAGRITFGGAARAQRRAALETLVADKPTAKAVLEEGPAEATLNIVSQVMEDATQAALAHLAAQPTPEPKLLPFPINRESSEF